MTVVTLVDQVCSDVLNISPSDGDNTATRARIVRGAQAFGGLVAFGHD